MEKPDLTRDGEQYSARGRRVQTLPHDIFHFVARNFITKNINTTAKLKTSVIFSGLDIEIVGICIYANEKTVDALNTIEFTPFSIDYTPQETVVRINWPKWSLRKPAIGLLFALKGPSGFFAAKVEAFWLGGTSGPGATCHQVNIGASQLYNFSNEPFSDWYSLVHNDNIPCFYKFKNSSKKAKTQRESTRTTKKTTGRSGEPKPKRRRKKEHLNPPRDSPPVAAPVVHDSVQYLPFSELLVGHEESSDMGYPGSFFSPPPTLSPVEHVEELPDGFIRYKGFIYALVQPIPTWNYSFSSDDEVFKSETSESSLGGSEDDSEQNCYQAPLLHQYFLNQDEIIEQSPAAEAPTAEL